jgi:hypothetical protein
MICLIGADGLAFVSLDTDRNLFLNHVSNQDSGSLSPKHSKRYLELCEIFDQHLQGETTRLQFLDQILSYEEIQHLSDCHGYNLITNRVYRELEA